MWNVAIPAPKRPENYPNRLLDCEAALEAAFLHLMSLASASGWAPGEICQGLLRLITAQNCEELEEAKLEAYLDIMLAAEQTRS